MRNRSRLREAGLLRTALAAAVLIACPAAATAQVPGVDPGPIPESPPLGDAPEFIGKPAKKRPVEAGPVPRHPFMAPNGRSNLHVDAYQSDAHRNAGPLGRSPSVDSAFFARECASVTFDARGRIVTICVGLDRPVLTLMRPRTLEVLATHPLPPRQPGTGNPFTDFSGGGYFYLDHRDRAVVPTTDGRILIIRQVQGPGFRVVDRRDPGARLGPGEKLISALPDWDGRIWFAGTDGTVGWAGPGGKIRSRKLGERISNSFAVGRGGGIYVVSDDAMYRLEPSRRGPRVIWRRGYANTGETKSGQTSPGSGTTPTLIGRRYVAITNNADPLNVLVMRRAPEPRKRRLVCRIPVLGEGRGSTDQSLVARGRSIVVENNFGYEGPASTRGGRTTEPGIERVDIRPPARLRRDPDRNCRPVWRSNQIAPSVVPKLSLEAGLVYTYTKPPGEPDDPWYLTTLDFRTGKRVYSRLAGAGLGFNNNYAPVTIGPDGSAYVGVLGGIVRIADRR